MHVYTIFSSSGTHFCEEPKLYLFSLYAYHHQNHLLVPNNAVNTSMVALGIRASREISTSLYVIHGSRS